MLPSAPPAVAAPATRPWHRDTHSGAVRRAARAGQRML